MGLVHSSDIYTNSQLHAIELRLTVSCSACVMWGMLVVHRVVVAVDNGDPAPHDRHQLAHVWQQEPAAGHGVEARAVAFDPMTLMSRRGCERANSHQSSRGLSAVHCRRIQSTT